MPPYQDSPRNNTESKLYKQEIFYDGVYYDVTNFVKRHPGGREIISYFTNPGEDATSAIQQFHGRSIDKVHTIMKSLNRRPATEIEGSCEDKATMEKNKLLTEDFTKLYLELKAEGLFDPSYFHVTLRIIEVLLFAMLGFHLVTQSTTVWIRFLGCFILTMAQGRAAWIMHEGGHISLTGVPKIDRLIQTFANGVFMGWSAKMWRRHHSLHHAMTQRCKRDVDLDLKPIFLNSMEMLDDPVKEQNFFMRNQIPLAPILSIAAQLYFAVWETGRCLLKYRIGAEFLAIGIHYLVAYQIGIWPWLACHWMLATYLSLNFSLSHTHLPVTNKPTHWVEHGLVHSADIEHRPWCNWWMGYLNYQIEHHLFPTMPQFRNPLAVERVKALAQKHGLPYYLFSYKDAVVRTANNVLEVSQRLKNLAKAESSQ